MLTRILEHHTEYEIYREASRASRISEESYKVFLFMLRDANLMECTVRLGNTPRWLAHRAPSIAGAMHQRSLFSEDHLLYSYCRFILLSLAVDTLARTSQNGDLLTLLQFLSSLQRNLLKLARPQVTSAYSMICGCADWVQMLEVSMVASCSAATMSDTRAWSQARRRRYLVNELPSWTTASGLFLI